MKRLTYIGILTWLGALSLEVSAQESLHVNEDSTVSFCFCGAGKQVYVETDALYVGEDSTRYDDLRTRRIKMQRKSDGCFHVTTPRIQPETYTYCFRVNGKRRHDTCNRDTAWQTIRKWNIVTVDGNEQAKLYQTSVQQGQLIRTCWNSTAEGLCRRVNIYLPAAYQMANDTCPNGKYPVLYLIHGINGYEGSWSERGRAIQIMENLVAQGRCEPMILVMPDVNFGVHEDRPSHHTLLNNVLNYPRLCHDRDLEKALVELVRMVDSAYAVSDTRYVVGFSDGARLAANTANLLPGYFSAVGMFSPVVHKEQLPQQPTADSILQLTTDYRIYTGKRDMFHGNAKRFHRRMEKANIPHAYTETIGGHTWRNWRLYLSDFLPSLFPSIGSE